MAQKTGKEETEFKVHEKIPLCINNCGFTGNPATNNMCQNCFNSASSSTTATTASTTATVTSTTTAATVSTTSRLLKVHRSNTSALRSGCLEIITKEATKTASFSSDRPRSDGFDLKREVNRCFGCRRKVGLTGFRCRCGELFCSEHRYTDRHVCSYDYKAAGREAIARENPVVKAAKIVRV